MPIADMAAHSLARSSVGRKMIVAATGIILLGFVIAHLLGNLLIFGGPALINSYARHLRDFGPGLWAARLILLAAVVVHIWTSIQLARENRRARGGRYAVKHSDATSYAARTMVLSGILLFAYIVYHLLHFTFGLTNPQVAHMTDPRGHHDVYAMMVLSFRNPVVSGVYIAAMALLCAHLSHGIGSVFQSLGLVGDKGRRLTGRFGRLLALALFIGYSSIPLSVLLGFVTLRGAP